MSSNKDKAGSALFEFFFIKPVPVVIWVMVLVLSGFLGFSSMVKEDLPDLEQYSLW